MCATTLNPVDINANIIMLLISQSENSSCQTSKTVPFGRTDVNGYAHIALAFYINVHSRMSLLV